MARTLHAGVHPEFIEGCFACKVSTVFVGSPSETVRETTAMASRWEKDMPAYKRLRSEGHQPRMIDGCDQLEATAKDRLTIATGIPLDTPSDIRAANEANEACIASGMRGI